MTTAPTPQLNGMARTSPFNALKSCLSKPPAPASSPPSSSSSTSQLDPKPELTTMKDKQGRRRPFSTWMKKLTNFKSSSPSDGAQSTNGGGKDKEKEKRNTYQLNSRPKKSSKNNNPYPLSSTRENGSAAPVNGHRSFSTVPTGNSQSASSLGRARSEERPPTGNKSTAATVNTDIAHSEAAPSHTASSGEAHTLGGNVSNGRGVDSTFSSPAPSVRSLTTTLTTIHSAVAPAPGSTSNPLSPTTTNGIQFSHQFPSSPPPTALPAHLAPHTSGGHPSTYNTATANNLLTDNASILTLASSSKRHRRRSMDTDASVRALAPSSLFGGSRESLPLSILSQTMDSSSASNLPTASALSRTNIAVERASIYSASGVVPERNSYYAGKSVIKGEDDKNSVKSGLMGHGRNDSISGSIGGIPAPSSPLAPRDAARVPSIGALSRTNSSWEDGGSAENEAPVEGQTTI